MLGFWPDLLSNALATLLGAVVGIPIALWLDRSQTRRREREKKDKILRLLSDELQHNQSKLSQWQASRSKQETTGTLFAELKDQLWRAFSDGGELQWVGNVTVLASLSHSYYLLSAAKYFSQKYFDSFEFGTARKHLAPSEKLLSELDNVASSYQDFAIGALQLIEQELFDDA